MTIGECRTCKHWTFDDDTKDMGWCCRFPPQWQGLPNVPVYPPMTFMWSGCGEWAADDE